MANGMRKAAKALPTPPPTNRGRSVVPKKAKPKTTSGRGPGKAFGKVTYTPAGGEFGFSAKKTAYGRPGPIRLSHEAVTTHYDTRGGRRIWKRRKATP